MKKGRPFLKHIHYFRGVAIINIMIPHLWEIPFPYKDSQEAVSHLVDLLREVMFHDTTIYFVYISGFLFYYLSPKFKLIKYYKGKLFNVICPYIFMTILVYILKYGGGSFSIDSFFSSCHEIAVSLLYGTAQIQYWYIPFISLVFIISPLLLNTSFVMSKSFLIFVSILPLLGTRTGSDLSVWQYVYFLPVYIQGMYIAKNYDDFLGIIKKRKIFIVLSMVISSLLIIYLYDNPLRYKMIDVSESLYYIQKLSIGALFILILQRIENVHIGLLDKFAQYSFALYFTHVIVKNMFPTYHYYLFLSKSSVLIFFASIFHVILVILLALFICFFIKKILGQRTRYFIGA